MESVMLRKIALCLAGSAALLTSGLAYAADIPGNRTTKAVLKLGLNGVKGTFEKHGDSDWYRVTLKKAQNYAFQAGLAEVGCVRLNLRNAKGKVLETARSDEAVDDGFEYRPNATKTFFVEFLAETCNGAHPFPREYHGHVAADARGDKTTGATIKVGQTIRGVLNWGHDPDYFRTKLDAGKTYTVSIESLEIQLSVLDSQGKVILSKFGSGHTKAEVKVPTGTYYIGITGDDDTGGSRYTLSLTGS
jgi:hypothetical protein